MSADDFLVQIDNLTCYSLETVDTASQVIHVLVLVAIVCLSFTGNSLVLVLVAKYKQLRIRSVILSLSMVVADLLFTLCTTLPAIVTTVTKLWLFGNGGCKAFGFLGSNFIITRWIIVSMLCVDRFCTVFFPFSYNSETRHGKCLTITFTCLAWIIPVVLSIPPMYSFADYKLRENQPNCLPTCENGRTVALCKLYYSIILTITFILGSVVPIILYSWLYYKGRKARKSMHSIKTGVTKFIIPEITGLHFTTSNDPTEKYISKRERAATFTFMLIFITVFITGTPSYCLQLIRSISFKSHCKIPIYVHFLIYELLLCASVLTPLVIMRDRDFRQCIMHLFNCKRRKTSDSFIRESRSNRISLSTSRNTQLSFNSMEGQESNYFHVVPTPTQESADTRIHKMHTIAEIEFESHSSV